MDCGHVKGGEKNKDGGGNIVCFLVLMERSQEALFKTCSVSSQGPSTAASQHGDRMGGGGGHHSPLSFKKPGISSQILSCGGRGYVPAKPVFKPSLWVLGPGMSRVKVRWHAIKVRGGNSM